MIRAALLFLLSLLPVTALAESPQDRVYASFGDVKVTVGDIEAAIALQAPAIRKRYQDPEKLKELADDLLRSELFAWEAKRRKLNENFHIQHERDRHAVQLFLRERVDEELESKPLTGDDIRAYYEENKSVFESPASARVAHVLVAREERARELIPQVQGMSVRDFRELARKESLDERTKLSGGDLRFIDAEGNAIGMRDVKVHPSIAKAAFTLDKPGDVYPEPVEVDGNYSVIVLRARREARAPGPEASSERIRSALMQSRRKEALEQLVNRLYAEVKPVLTDRLLSKIEVPAQTPPTSIGHEDH